MRTGSAATRPNRSRIAWKHALSEKVRYLSRRLFFLAVVGFTLSLLSAIPAVLSGFGTQLGWWNFRTGFLVLKVAALAGAAATTAAIAGGVMAGLQKNPRVAAFAVAGTAIGLVVTCVPWSWQLKARQLPLIHDITTDTANPPTFKAILPIRKRAPNRSEYRGQKTAAIQRRAYPDIQPLVVGTPSSKTFEHALATARRMGWSIVDANRAEGRIEAIATTFWFGFQDDVIIRVKRTRGGSRLDLRSVSRVGAGDAGTNAARIRTYLKEFNRIASLQPPASRNERQAAAHSTSLRADSSIKTPLVKSASRD